VVAVCRFKETDIHYRSKPARHKLMNMYGRIVKKDLKQKEPHARVIKYSAAPSFVLVDVVTSGKPG
jgi:hypothetical protein